MTDHTPLDGPDVPNLTNNPTQPEVTPPLPNGFVPPEISVPAVTLPIQLLQTADMVPVVDPAMSADEIALYDRQIRLWGMKAQELIRGANILLIGMKALGNEIAKNLVLAGVGTLTILDHELVSEADLCSQFLVSQDDIGKSRAQAAVVQLRKMNPRVNLFTDPAPLVDKVPQYFSSFDVTIATNLPSDLCTSVNMACNSYNRKFYSADVHGVYGYIFSDLVSHEFRIERDRSNLVAQPMTKESLTCTVIAVETKRESDKVKEIVTKRESYSLFELANSSPLTPELTRSARTRSRVTPLLTCLRALFDFQKETGGRFPAHNRADLEVFARLANQRHLELGLSIETLRSDFLRSFIQNLGSEISPVAAFLGGHLAQDVINVLGAREAPLQNMLLFDGEESKAHIYSLHPKNDPNVSAQMSKMQEVNGNGTADISVPTAGLMNGVQLV